MLYYVDAKRALRVVRSDDLTPKARSVPVAAIAKKTFEIKFAEHASLSAGERLEIEGVAARFRAATEMGERPIVWRFLEDVRRVAEYYSTQADEVEKRIISTALQRSERAIRKSTAHPVPSPATGPRLANIHRRMRLRLDAAAAEYEAGRHHEANRLADSVISETPSEWRGERWYDIALARSSRFQELLQSSDRRRIYVAGCGRSGTWLALGMMATYAGVYITAEERHFGHFGMLADRLEPVQVVKRMHDAYRDLHEVPECISILYVLRDPRDVLTSTHGQQKNYISLERWTHEIAALERLLSSGRANVKVVRFEDLATRTERCQAEVADEFGLEAKHPALEFHRVYRPSPGALAAMHQLRPPDPSAIGRWRRDPEDIKYVTFLVPELKARFSALADRFGYDLDD